MPIDMPHNRPPRSANRISDHVRCADFIFRIADVDAFSHQPVPEGEPVTVVNFKGYTQAIPDAERRLFEFLLRNISPKSSDETD